MSAIYFRKILIYTVLMALVTYGVSVLGKVNIPWNAYFGLVFLASLMLLIHLYIYGNKLLSENAVIRRIMTGSMLRLLFGVLFMAISLYYFRPISVPFVVSYCIYFAIFLVFEISEIRTNLRPDTKPAPKNENA
jgi:hypothetical protein